MSMTISITDSQRLFAKAGFYSAVIDGDFGPKTKQAIESILGVDALNLPKNWSTWDRERKRIAACQVILKKSGFYEVGAIDGFVGPSTQFAMSNWNHLQTFGKLPEHWRTDDIPQDLVSPVKTTGFPFQDQVTKIYGNPGGSQCTAGKIKLPFKMKIAWDLESSITEISCHEKIADSATRAYSKINSAFSPEDIDRLGFNKFGGCYNFRKMRGGNTFSMHSYGIAIDHDPEHNQLKWGKDRASLASAECIEFWRIWESEGWLSLGRARNYDWMHVQAARLR